MPTNIIWIVILIASAAVSIGTLRLLCFLQARRTAAGKPAAQPEALKENGIEAEAPAGPGDGGSRGAVFAPGHDGISGSGVISDGGIRGSGVMPGDGIRGAVVVYKAAGISVAVVLLVFFGIKHIANVPIILLHYGVFLIGTMIADSIMAARQRRRASATEDTHKQSAEQPFGEKREPGADTKDCGRSTLSRRMAAAAVGCLVYLAAGLLCANIIVRTEYTLTTDKELPNGELCIVQISDAHLGTTIDERDFKRLVRRVASEKPDIVVITGDLTDSGTKREMMQRCCAELGALKPEFGVYYVPGNHDSGEGQFDVEELQAELEKNGVRVLEDEYVFPLKGCAVIGRKDATASRERVDTLFARFEASRGEPSTESPDGRVDESCLTILLDHQPNDFAAEAETGADLVLCGHAHGGFLLPIKWMWKIFPKLIFEVDLCEGKKRINNTDFIVSSGAGTCLTDFKTGTKSEYVVIRLKNKGQ